MPSLALANSLIQTELEMMLARAREAAKYRLSLVRCSIPGRFGGAATVKGGERRGGRRVMLMRIMMGVREKEGETVSKITVGAPNRST